VKPDLKQDAQLLRDNDALTKILDSLLTDLVGQFLTTPEDKLVELKYRCNAIHELRGKIDSELMNILETA